MYNGMIDERFVTFKFNNPLPKTDRVVDFPQCARCCAATLAPSVTPVPPQ